MPLCGQVLVALVLATVGSTARAAAPADESIGVLPVVVEGELAPSWRARLQQRLHDGLARGRRPVLELAPRHACDDGCERGLAAEAGARWFTRARVRMHDRDFEIEVELVDARDGARVTHSAGVCEVCAIEEAGDMLADRAGVLDRKLDALLDAPPIVRLESRPAGALLWLDGTLVGVSPQQRTVAEGRHRARAELRGHLPIEVQFDALAGTRESVALELSPLPKPSPTLQRAGWGVLAAGLAGVAIGAPLLALHGRPYRGRCSGADIDGDGDCRFRYGTRTGGAIAVALGAAAVVTGVVLLVRARQAPRRRMRAALRGTAVAF